MSLQQRLLRKKIRKREAKKLQLLNRNSKLKKKRPYFNVTDQNIEENRVNNDVHNEVVGKSKLGALYKFFC
uniref:Uncharacterized protein n=1 Tax=Rhodnius prolixus TaxID=13249 RepID=T1I9H5_RHOPR